jgi:hypothetical protein|tara:strand:+ start:121 stop:825 length:705 start_codon:yes stop_codon:yes gene_type:complete
MENDHPAKGQIAAWAIACSLSAASKEMIEQNIWVQCLQPELQGASWISLTKENNVVFSNLNLVRVAGGTFAIPKIACLLKKPIKSLGALLTLIKIRRVYLKKNHTMEQVRILMLAGLETAVCYLNFHSYSKSLMVGESGKIDFYVKEKFLGSVSCSTNNFWQTSNRNTREKPSIIVTFKDLSTAYRGALGKIDPLVDAAEKNVLIRGRIPLIEKFGYISRLAMKEVPIPKTVRV